MLKKPSPTYLASISSSTRRSVCLGSPRGSFLGSSSPGEESSQILIKSELCLTWFCPGASRKCSVGGSLNIFHFRVGDRCAPFFQTIRKRSRFEWTPACEETFQELKRYLASPLVMSVPASAPLSVSGCNPSLGLDCRNEMQNKKPVYYVSRVLQDTETRYPTIEKFALTLVGDFGRISKHMRLLFLPANH